MSTIWGAYQNKAFHGFCGFGCQAFEVHCRNAEDILFGTFAPLFNDYFAIVKTFKKRIYVHEEIEKADRGGDFTIIREIERYIEFLSNNTKHCWIIFKNLGGTDKPVMVYHKHSRNFINVGNI